MPSPCSGGATDDESGRAGNAGISGIWGSGTSSRGTSGSAGGIGRFFGTSCRLTLKMVCRAGVTLTFTQPVRVQLQPDVAHHELLLIPEGGATLESPSPAPAATPVPRPVAHPSVKPSPAPTLEPPRMPSEKPTPMDSP